MKTASRVLGTSFFLSGFVVQDAPRYGAERRGAPIFAYVRADTKDIRERSDIRNPDLIAVADDTLFQTAAAGILAGATEKTIFLVNSRITAADWKARLNLNGSVLNLPHPPGQDDDIHMAGVMLAAATAALTGVIAQSALNEAMDHELAYLGPDLSSANKAAAAYSYNALLPHAGLLKPGQRTSLKTEPAPRWIRMHRDDPFFSAPDIHGAHTSESVQTGLWRTVRPVFHEDLCHGCTWICGTLCPDSAITTVKTAEGQRPLIDYGHCKGCEICSTVCPNHAFETVLETSVSSSAPTQGAGS